MLGKWRDKFANCHLNSRMVLLAFVVLFGSIFLASGQPTPGWYSYGGVLMDGYHPGVEWQQQDTKSQEIQYAVGTDGSLWLCFYDGSGWLNLGGQITSNPYVVRDFAQWDHVFVRGTDGHLWDRRVDIKHITSTAAPGDWIDLGGYIKAGTSPTINSVADGYGYLAILVHGGDDGLWGKLIQVTAGSYTEITPIQEPWVNLGGKIIGSPDAFSIFTAVRGTDNALWANTWNPFGSESPKWYPLGGVLASDPSVNIDGNYLLIYAKGTDGHLWVNQFDETTMTGAWTDLGGQISGTDSPTLSSNLDKTAHALVKGTDNGLWDCVLPGGIWYNLGGQITSKPEAFTYNTYSSSFYVFVRGSDGALWRYLKF
jgi:hypothetical protein